MRTRARLQPILVLLLAACSPSGGATLSLGEAATGSPLPSTDGTPAASATIGPSSAVPGIPADFPVMDGMEPTEGSPSPDVILAWRTSANGAEVFAFYDQQLAAAGYEVGLAGPGGSVAVFRFTPPAGTELQLDLYADDSGTTVELRPPAP